MSTTNILEEAKEKSMEDTTQVSQPTMDPSFSTSSLERTTSGEDPGAMTIEFLRARLLSERSVSKAARQRAQQLAKKVLELEGRLESEIKLRKKLEVARLEVLSKYRAQLSMKDGDFFSSSFAEDGFASFSDNGLTEHPRPGTHDINEGFLQYTPDEDEEGLPISRTDHLDGRDSSKQLNYEEINEDYEEIDHSGIEKGILAWGRRKGSRKLHDKEIGYGTDWLGRNFSQRSLASVDGESPKKTWVGKSVRQIRKKENRPYDVNLEEEPGQTQDPEDFDGKSSHPDGTKESLQCEDERDTEVERVLERQAELIEQFEAEENAQRAWEAKFEEQETLATYKFVEGITQSEAGSTLETVANQQSVEEGLRSKDDAAKVVEVERVSRSQLVSKVSTQHLRKVHPDNCRSEGSDAMQEGLVQSETFQGMVSEDVSRAENGKGRATTVESETSSDDNQSKIDNTALKEKLPKERQSGIDENKETVDGVGSMPAETDRGDEVAKVQVSQSLPNKSGVSKEEVSQDQVSTVTNIENRGEHARDPFVEGGKPDRYKKSLSSSFRFTVFADAEPVTSSSPQMPGFAAYKQDTHTAEQYREIQKEEILLKGGMVDNSTTKLITPSEQLVDTDTAEQYREIKKDVVFLKGGIVDNSTTKLIRPSEQLVVFGVNNAGRHHLSTHASMTASNEHAISMSCLVASDNSTLSRQDTGSQQAESRANVPKGTTQRERQSSLVRENDHRDRFPSHASSDNLVKDSLWGEVLKRRTRVQEGGQDLKPGLAKSSADFPPQEEFHMQQTQYALPQRDRPNFYGFSSLPGNASGIPVPMSHVNAYDDIAFSNHRKSVDGGFDRVAEALRDLQIARRHVQNSNEQATLMAGLDAAYRSGYDGSRDAFYAEPPRFPPVYPAPPQYVAMAPYSSRRLSPLTPDMQGWGAAAAGYRMGTSRQPANAPHAQYMPSLAETRNFWPPPPPPPQGVHYSNLYHHDTRHQR